MNKCLDYRALGAALFAFIALFNSMPSMASTVAYTTSLQSGNACTGCGPFGTVEVSTVDGFSNELSVTLTLTSGEVFAKTGAGAALLFDIAGNPSLSVSGLTSGFSFQQPQNAKKADGSGHWDTYIQCDVCGSGTSPPENSGPVSFMLSVASGTLAPTSFVTNDNNFLFASDIGIPDGSNGYYTGDVTTGTYGALTAVPLPAAAWLLLSGLGALGAITRKDRST